VLVARIEVLGEVDERGAIRFDVQRASTVRGLDGRPVDVLVEDFSRTGFRFLADSEFPIGTLLAVGLSGAGQHEAKLVWREGHRHGCEFLVPLPRSRMARAFTGREAIVADLQAELDRRFAQAEPPTPPVPRWRAILRRLLGR
jgi:hypothetical protein